MRRTLLLLLLFITGLGPGILLAQNGGQGMADGIMAFREGRYPDAVRAFSEVIELSD